MVALRNETQKVAGRALVRNGRGVSGRLISEEIIVAAAQEFAERGYRGTNLRHVSVRLGVTRQALYYYYERKHDILKAIFMNFFDELEGVVTEAATTTSDPAEKFRAMLRGHFEVVASKPLISRIFVQEEASLTRADRAAVRLRRRHHQEVLVAAYEEGVAAGAYRPINSKLAVSVILGSGNWMYRWVGSNRKLTPAQVVTFAEQVLFAGYGADSREILPKRRKLSVP